VKKAALLALLLFVATLELYVCAAFMPFHWRGPDLDSPVSGGLFLLAIFMSVTLIALGVVCFVSPDTVQGYALKQNSKWFPANPFLGWMKTVEYLRLLRLIGFVVFVAGLLAAFVLLKRLGETAFI
jgi:nitric oxide reductase large subunit